MDQIILTLLKRWESSLINFGKLDDWRIIEDYSELASFIASDYPKKVRYAVKECRDYAISERWDAERLLSIVQNANRILRKRLERKAQRTNENDEVVGQSKRFKSTTRKLYNEELKCKTGTYLKDVDITIESGAMSRLVRRIVEKRMCQAYYQLNKNCVHDGGHDRHWMKRATSFQLHNLGQIEHVSGICRSESTHWKRTNDPVTGERIFKKKLGYTTYEEAAKAALQYHQEKGDKRPVHAYKCAFCGKWHIGHFTPEIMKSYPEKAKFLGAASELMLWAAQHN